jgi:hypothetical protein
MTQMERERKMSIVAFVVSSGILRCETAIYDGYPLPSVTALLGPVCLSGKAGEAVLILETVGQCT